MANFNCCVHSDCQDPSNPIANFTAEGPDPDIFIGLNYGGGVNNPPNLGWDFTSTGCVGTCLSTVSQSDADLCAQSQQIVCSSTQNQGGGGGGGGGGFKPPGNKPPTIFGSAATHCDILCPDGSTFRFSVPPNAFQAYSQAYADAVAQSIACLEGQSERMCLNDIQKEICVNDFYADIIETEGGTAPITYTIVSGSLPPGFSFVQSNDFSVDVEGNCPVPGNYTFSVRATDRFGLFMVKTYTIGIVGITNSPTPANVGSAYSFSFTVSGGTAPYSFALTSGSLPTGLVMDASGNITGTPTASGASAFTVQVTDANNISCPFPETLNVSNACDCSISWFPSVGTCRLRIAGYVDGLVSNCPGGVASGAPAWDGTLSRWDPPPNNVNGEYAAPITPPATSMNGEVLWAVTLVFTGTTFTLAILGDIGGIASTAWSGSLVSSCPIGVYTRNIGCSAGPATITIEGYTP